MKTKSLLTYTFILMSLSTPVLAQSIDMEFLLKKKAEMDSLQEKKEDYYDPTDPYQVARKAYKDGLSLLEKQGKQAALPAFCTAGKLGNLRGAYECSKIIVHEYRTTINKSRYDINKLKLAIEFTNIGIQDEDLRAYMNLGLMELLKENSDVVAASDYLITAYKMGDFSTDEIYIAAELLYNNIIQRISFGTPFNTQEYGEVYGNLLKLVRPLHLINHDKGSALYKKAFER